MKQTRTATHIQQVERFLSTPSPLKKLIVVYGPTASGKTDMSIELAQYLDTHIISTDSRQIFRAMDIGTGKITDTQMQGVPHHMIDIVDPNENYSVGAFKKQSEHIIDTLHSKGKIPILCGGTGLYIDALIYDFDIPTAPKDDTLRKQLELEAAEKGNEYIFQKLTSLDPDYDRNLHPNNLRYVIRALEVKMLTGKSKTSFKGEKRLKYHICFLTPPGPADMYSDVYRSWLYDRINTRVEHMFQNGLVEENQNLREAGYHKTDFGMKSIGYSEVQDYLDGNGSLDECQQQVQQNSRNYAKRQLTWFKKYN